MDFENTALLSNMLETSDASFQSQISESDTHVTVLLRLSDNDFQDDVGNGYKLPEPSLWHTTCTNYAICLRFSLFQ